MTCNKNYQKSAQRAYTTTVQTVTATTVSPITILGTLDTDTGCSVETTANGFKINQTGLYRISYDMVVTPTAAGTATISLAINNTTIPGTTLTETTEVGNSAPVHIEVIRCFSVCPNFKPIVSAQITGVAGTVANVNASAIRLA